MAAEQEARKQRLGSHKATVWYLEWFAFREKGSGMHVLNAAQIAEWFAGVPNRDNGYLHQESCEPFFTHPEGNCINIEHPPKLERLPFLARYLATIGYEAADFRGALLWFTNWGMWNPLDEGPGYRLVEAIRVAAGQPVSFESAAGQLFRADELDQALGLLLQPMIFAWDANYYPLWSYGHDQFFLHVSHDSYVSVVTRTKEFYDKAFGLLKEVGLHPSPGREEQLRRFCHPNLPGPESGNCKAPSSGQNPSLE